MGAERLQAYGGMARHITYGHESAEKLENGDRSQEKLKNVQDDRGVKVNRTHPLA